MSDIRAVFILEGENRGVGPTIVKKIRAKQVGGQDGPTSWVEVGCDGRELRQLDCDVYINRMQLVTNEATKALKKIIQKKAEIAGLEHRIKMLEDHVVECVKEQEGWTE